MKQSLIKGALSHFRGGGVPCEAENINFLQAKLSSFFLGQKHQGKISIFFSGKNIMEKYQFFFSGKTIKGKYQVFRSCFFGSFALLTALATLVIFIDAIVREIGEN